MAVARKTRLTAFWCRRRRFDTRHRETYEKNTRCYYDNDDDDDDNDNNNNYNKIYTDELDSNAPMLYCVLLGNIRRNIISELSKKKEDYVHNIF